MRDYFVDHKEKKLEIEFVGCNRFTFDFDWFTEKMLELLDVSS